ncbi:MAG TPA: gluconate 2-dehydrogenase subunit 3 family protein [Bryobacteraceae bacterium]|nr:gluconate 2-dehydrogenase subunit 3 family protein [Bryobacteraceae bacterium]
MSISRRNFAAVLAGTTLLPAQAPAGAAPKTSLEHTDAALEAEEKKPRFFDDHQLSTVAILADLIIPRTDTPGARDAQVHQHLDEILFVAPRNIGTSFLDGLSWLDGYCLQAKHNPFNQLAAADQTKILMLLLDAEDESLRPGHEFARSMKQWTARIYYSTQDGQQELNKGGRVPAHYSRACTV